MRILAPLFLAASAAAAFGQAKPAEPPNLLKNGGFELPAVKGRTTNADGGSPSKVDEDKSTWRQFMLIGKDAPGEGTIAMGLTTQFARTGKQSIFVDFQKLSTRQRKSYLLGDLVPVQPGWGYRVSLWGRTDAKRPLTLDQRRPMLRCEMEFFTPDQDEQAGELEHRTQMIPGHAKKLTFVSNRWSEFSTSVRAPLNATWMKVTFRFESTSEAGTTDGTIYFDDAEIREIPDSGPPIPIDPKSIPKSPPMEEEDETETETEEGAASPNPAPAPAPAPKPGGE